MEYFLQQTINGASLGAIYALVAIGYSLVYGALGMINFAHGDIFMIGAFVALAVFLLLPVALPLAFLLALLAAVIVTACYGLALERIAYRPLRNSFRLAPLISAIGMSIALQNMVQITQGSRVKPLPDLALDTITIDIGFSAPLYFNPWQLALFAITIILLLLLRWLLTRTPLGLALRATAEDRMMATILGVSVHRTIAVTFVVGAACAGIAGLMVALYYGVADFFMGFMMGLKAFTAAVLGGIGSVLGAVIGGLIIGLLEAYWSGYVDAQYKDVAVFAVLILMLLVRPNGLFGKPEVEKV